MAIYDQPKDVDTRVRFFDGQFLVDQDFVDEQKYHLDRERRLGKVLRITGIAEGLAVSAGQPNKVTISPGTAIDGDGRQIVLAKERTLDLPAAAFNNKSAVKLYIVYREQAVEKATVGSESERRWHENPLIAAVAPDGTSTDTWDSTLTPVLLAQLSVGNNGAVAVDSSVAPQYAGLGLRGNIGVGTTSPGAKLEVAQGSGLAIKVEPASNSSVFIGRSEDNSLQFDFGSGQAINSTASLSFNMDSNNDDANTRFIDFRANGKGFAGGSSLLRVLESGNVGIGTTSPQRLLEVGPNPTGTGTISSSSTTVSGSETQFQTQLRKGDFITATYAATIGGQTQTVTRTRQIAADITSNTSLTTNTAFDPPIPVGTAFTFARPALQVNGISRLGGIANYDTTPLLSVAPGTIQFDAPGVPGGRLIIDGATGNVGIGTASPRTALDIGTGVMSGAPNDYQKAQFTMTGGGTVTWGGKSGRLKWTARFIAISMERGLSFSGGHVNINQPTAPLPAANVYDGAARAADASGVTLNEWEALYAVHTVGGNENAVSSFQIRRYTNAFSAPSNWLLVAVVNGDDNTVKLGTGVIISANSSSSYGNPLPRGTVLMWSGTADQIPGGWAICNGQNGTPDLRARFIVGAGSGGSPEYTPGQFGEPDQHAHSIGIPGTTFTTSSAGSHNHAPPAEWYDRGLLGDAAAAGKSYYNSIDRGNNSVSVVRTSTDPGHAHTVAVNIAAFNSGASSGNNRPKWYALCFIMKL